MIGGLIKEYRMTISHIWIPIIMVIFNYIYQASLINDINTTACSFFYSSLVVVVFVISVMLYVLNVKFNRNNKIIKNLSNLFLLVFTLHSFFVGIGFKIAAYTGYLAPLTTWIVVSAITVSMSWILMKLPYANKIFRI